MDIIYHKYLNILSMRTSEILRTSEVRFAKYCIRLICSDELLFKYLILCRKLF